MSWFAALHEHPAAEAAPPHLRADALRSYGGSADLAGQHDAAEQLWQRSLALVEQLGDEHGRAVLLHRLAVIALRRGELVRARELTETSHEIHQRTDDRWGHAQTLGTLGAITRDAGDEQRALELIEQSAAMAREMGVRWWESGMLAELAALSLNADRLDDAESHARESLVLAEQLGDRAGRVFGVGLLARVAAERGRSELAARLWSAVESEDAGAPLGGWRRHRHTSEARIRDVAGPDFERGYSEGRALTLDDAVSLALEADDA